MLGELGKQPVHIQGWIRFSGEGPPPPSQSADDFILSDGTPDDALSPPYVPPSAAVRHYATAPVTLKEFEAGEAATADAPALLPGPACGAVIGVPPQQGRLPAPGEEEIPELYKDTRIR